MFFLLQTLTRSLEPIPESKHTKLLIHAPTSDDRRIYEYWAHVLQGKGKNNTSPYIHLFFYPLEPHL
jgi:hypothetical protein